MEPVARLVHKTYTTFLPTAFPAHYYGMPDGKIYLIFSRFYNAAYGQAGLEFVFAEHREFSYDYENNKIFQREKEKQLLPVFAETIDKPHPKLKILDTIRDLRSYGEALLVLNQRAAEKVKFAG